MAAEVTLQPMRRFAFDAAIVFADILLLPMALGQEVWFEAGEGPRLGPLPPLDALRGEVEASTGELACVGETLRRVRAELEPERALIGFAGGPWTVATYMLVRAAAARRPGPRRGRWRSPSRSGSTRWSTSWPRPPSRYLAMQAEAGAQALQLFESWAELLPEPTCSSGW